MLWFSCIWVLWNTIWILIYVFIHHLFHLLICPCSMPYNNMKQSLVYNQCYAFLCMLQAMHWGLCSLIKKGKATRQGFHCCIKCNLQHHVQMLLFLAIDKLPFLITRTDELVILLFRFLQKATLRFLQNDSVNSIIQLAVAASLLDHREANMSVMKFYVELIKCVQLEPVRGF